MPSSGMGRRVALVITDVSEEFIASIFRVKRVSTPRRNADMVQNILHSRTRQVAENAVKFLSS
jgi:hypothetical protein